MSRWNFLCLFSFLLTTPLAADDKPDPEAPKKLARENWEKIEAGPLAMHQTDHFLIVAPMSSEGKLKEWGTLIEKTYDLAAQTLYGQNDTPFKGILTIYLLPNSEQINTFIRRIEKRRPLGRENGTYSVDDDRLFIAVGPRDKSEPPIEVYAAQQVASVLLQRKVGKSTILPYWLLSGFGRATYYRLMPNLAAVKNERTAATRLLLAKKLTAQNIWNGSLEGDDPALLNPSLADFFAYGPGRMKFLAMLEAFKPGENEAKKSTEQTLQAVDLTTDIIIKGFRNWMTKPN
jgi:hypothetical protein